MAEIRLTDALLEEIQRRALEGDVSEFYIKACRHRLAVTVVDPFSGSPEVRILKGDTTDPDMDIDDCLVALYTPHDAEFFKKNNRTLIREGLIVPYTLKTKEEILVNAVSDEELEEALEKPFFAVKALLDKFTSPTPVERLLRMANEKNKTVGVIEAIENKLSELQDPEVRTSGE